MEFRASKAIEIEVGIADVVKLSGVARDAGQRSRGPGLISYTLSLCLGRRRHLCHSCLSAGLDYDEGSVYVLYTFVACCIVYSFRAGM